MCSVNARSDRGNQGFTLLELMVVVAIIGILAAISIPAFQNYQSRSRRSEAMTNLAAIAKVEKAYFSEYNTYVGVDQPYPGVTIPSTSKRPWTALAQAQFGVVGWYPEGDVYYDYDVVVGEGGCPDSDCFTAVAYGDADGDGVLAVVQYVQPNATGLIENDRFYGLGAPVEPVTGRVQLNEVAVNYAAGLY